MDLCGSTTQTTTSMITRACPKGTGHSSSFTWSVISVWDSCSIPQMPKSEIVLIIIFNHSVASVFSDQLLNGRHHCFILHSSCNPLLIIHLFIDLVTFFMSSRLHSDVQLHPFFLCEISLQFNLNWQGDIHCEPTGRGCWSPCNLNNDLPLLLINSQWDISRVYNIEFLEGLRELGVFNSANYIIDFLCEVVDVRVVQLKLHLIINNT